MERRMNNLRSVILAAALILAALPAHSYAQEVIVEHHYRHNKKIIEVLPSGYREIVYGGRHFYFREGVFYERGPKGYAIVEAPVGAAVTVMPAGFKIVRIRRARYYFLHGVYYKFLPARKVYVVVRRPI